MNRICACSRVGKSAVIVIESKPTHAFLLCLGKDTLRHFPLLGGFGKAVLNFSHIFIKN